MFSSRAKQMIDRLKALNNIVEKSPETKGPKNSPFARSIASPPFAIYHTETPNKNSKRNAQEYLIECIACIYLMFYRPIFEIFPTEKLLKAINL